MKGFTNPQMQSATQAMETYFSAIRDPSLLRVDTSGNVEIAGKFTLLFDRFIDDVRQRIDRNYRPVNWEAKAREVVITKLEQSLKNLVPGESRRISEKALTLINTLTEQVKASDQHSWKGLLYLNLELMKNSDADRKIYGAISILFNIGQFTSPEIENEVLAKIGGERIDLAHLTEDGQKKIHLALQTMLKDYFMRTFDLPFSNAQFGAEVLMDAMSSYRMTLSQAMELLDIPAALMLENGFQRRPTAMVSFIREQIAREVSNKYGIPLRSARNGAEKIDRLMRRYGIKLKEALDLSEIVVRLADIRRGTQPVGKDPIPSTEPGYALSTSDLDSARAVQQVIARDRCTISEALQIVERRNKALPRIQECLPSKAQVSIVGGTPCVINAVISENSRSEVYKAIKTLKDLDPSEVTEPGRNTKLIVAEEFRIDALRNSNIVLDDRGEITHASKNFRQLLSDVYAFADHPEVMRACSDSFNQALLGSIFGLIISEKNWVFIQSSAEHNSEETTDTHQTLWHFGKRDDSGKVTIRHLYMQKAVLISRSAFANGWPVNRGDRWAGDPNPHNAGFTIDFSYAFDEEALKKGERNPEILECRYWYQFSLDWDAIDQKLQDETAKDVKQ